MTEDQAVIMWFYIRSLLRLWRQDGSDAGVVKIEEDRLVAHERDCGHLPELRRLIEERKREERQPCD